MVGLHIWKQNISLMENENSCNQFVFLCGPFFPEDQFIKVEHVSTNLFLQFYGPIPRHELQQLIYLFDVV